MKNNKIIFILSMMIFVGALSAFLFFSVKHSQQTPQLVLNDSPDQQIEYWTCSMHPQVHKQVVGKCPICGMELIPVYQQDVGKIVVEKAIKEHLGFNSQPTAYRHLVRVIRLSGRVSHDYELYSLQQEYLSVLSSLDGLKKSSSEEIIERQDALLKATKLRLNLLGISNEQIKILEQEGKPDESLIYPEQGRVWIQADIYQQDIDKIKPGQLVKAKIKGYTQGFEGQVYSVEKVLNVQTRSALARIEIKDRENILKHEVYAELTLEIHLGDRLSIPYTSLIDTGTRKVVYIDLGEGRYQLTQVKTGIDAQGYVEVLDGLKQGDMVVTEGNFLLDSQTTLTGGQSLLYGAGEAVKETPKAQPVHRH
ncbi:MAG: efflux RND transporter periplasmic adaptor subunit [Candidatus Omnitrophota bacterium]